MNHNIDFEFADIYKEFINDFLESKHSRYSLFGGRDSAKSTTAYMLELLTVLTTGNVMVVRRYKNNIPSSSYNGLIKIISQYKLNHLFKIKKSPIQIQCLVNGYCIDFQGLDNPDKIKSAEASVGVYKLLVFEEAQEISQRALCDEVISTFERGENSDGFKCLWIFNPPPNKKSWHNLELRESNDDLDLKALRVNYCDIPKEWVGLQQLKEIARVKKNNSKLYKYRYLGEPIAAEDIVFENVVIETISDKSIEQWEVSDDYIFNGLDFGWTDPNAAITAHYDIDNRVLYIYREFYKNHLNSEQLYNSLINAGFDEGYRMIADSASPDKIADLHSFGWNIIGCNKKAVSVKAGFEWLMGLTAIVIDEQRCPNVAAEFTEYHYELDKDGGISDSQLYKWSQADHTISATRYALEKLIKTAGV